MRYGEPTVWETFVGGFESGVGFVVFFLGILLGGGFVVAFLFGAYRLCLLMLG